MVCKRLTLALLPWLAVGVAGAADFDSAVKPLLAAHCSGCHNAQLASGGLNLSALMSAETIESKRDQWELVEQMARTGGMPPPGIPRPPHEEIETMVAYLRAEFDRIDRQAKLDPGRVTARRLNRAEYTNAVRDLLGVDFRADENFPGDDSGYGFDNIGDVLTLSPLLMEKYLNAAEVIASRAVGADPLPEKPLESEYHSKDKKIRRLDVSTIEARHLVEWDGEYVVRVGLPGERSEDAAPVRFGFWMDGKLLYEKMVETKPSGLVYFNPYSEEEFRLFLPVGDHVFRAGFINDPFVEGLSEKDAYDSKKNKYLTSITFVGPFPSEKENPSRKRMLVCDPESGEDCLRRILSKLARRAYRRPVTAEDVDGLMGFVEQARKEGLTTEQGLQYAIQAILVSPHFLMKIERDPDPTDPTSIHPVSDLELASRLSFFLWSSIPDEELLALAEQGKLSESETLMAQVHRMLADERSSALAANFAGQWLETRNLESVNPDPELFPEWGPELRDAMKEETRLFFEAMLKEDRPLKDFLDADFTYLNGLLAKHYGIEGVRGPDFRRVALATEQRGGILSQAAVLTVTSYPTRTSPVIRGKYVLSNILGTPPPEPPPNVPALEASAEGKEMSLREKLEQHRANPTCASCHARMDALGFGLENYDAIGRWRTEEGKFPVDASGTLPSGESFTSPAELRSILTRDLSDFARNLTEKMMIYALGRGLERYDKSAVNVITIGLLEDGGGLRDLIRGVIASAPFQMRRGEAVETTAAPEPSKPAVKEIAAR